MIESYLGWLGRCIDTRLSHVLLHWMISSEARREVDAISIFSKLQRHERFVSFCYRQGQSNTEIFEPPTG